MARRTIVVDDLDGSEGAREVIFGLDGESWRIDLGEHNRERLRAALSEFIEAGVKVVGSRTRVASGRWAHTVSEGLSTSMIREWAIASGYAVSERGRIPATVLAAYEAANSATAKAAG